VKKIDKKRSTKRTEYFITILLFSLTLILFLNSASATSNIYLNENGGNDNNNGNSWQCDKATIQQEANIIDNHDTINVANEKYKENLNINNNVNFGCQSGTFTINNCNIQNNKVNYGIGGGMENFQETCTVNNNIITNNNAPCGGGNFNQGETCNTNPTTIKTVRNSKFTASCNKLNNEKDLSFLNPSLVCMDGISLTSTTNLEQVESSSSICMDNGIETSILAQNVLESPISSLSTIGTIEDGKNLLSGFNVIQIPVTPSEPSLNEVNAASQIGYTGKTIGMQETGLPLTGLVLAILALFGGLISSKRK
jgi:hypothetical protein